MELEADITNPRERLAPVLPPELIADITGDRGSQEAGFIALGKRAAPSIAGQIVGGAVGTAIGGPPLGMALGAGGGALGELIGQQTGLNPEDPNAVLFSAAPLPAAGGLRFGIKRVPGATGGLQQSFVTREIGTELGKRGALLAQPLLPKEASKTLYKQFEQLTQGQNYLIDPQNFRTVATEMVDELADFGIRAPKPVRDLLDSPQGTQMSLETFNQMREVIGQRLGALKKHPARGAMSQMYAASWDEMDQLAQTGVVGGKTIPPQIIETLKGAVAANKRERAVDLISSLADKRVIFREGLDQVDANSLITQLSRNDVIKRFEKLGVGLDEVEDIRKTIAAYSHLPLTQQSTMIGFAQGLPFGQRLVIQGALGAIAGGTIGGGPGAIGGAGTILAIEGISSLLMSKGGRKFVQFIAEHPMATDQFVGMLFQLARTGLLSDLTPAASRIADVPGGSIKLQQAVPGLHSEGTTRLPSLTP